MVSFKHLLASLYLSKVSIFLLRVSAYDIGTESTSLFLVLYYLSYINFHCCCRCYFPLFIVYCFVLSQGSQSFQWCCVICSVKQYLAMNLCAMPLNSHTMCSLPSGDCFYFFCVYSMTSI